MTQYVALLRGINVGGKNVIRIPALKACVEALGLRDVATYIQSGNVLFAAARPDQRGLTRRLEDALSKTFAYRSRVIVRSFEQMKAAVDGAPEGFGTRPGTYRYDVIFLKGPLTPDEAMTSVTARRGVDRVHAGDGVLYFSRLISRAAQSHLPRLVATPAYQNMTIRNWNTTARLVELMERSAPRQAGRPASLKSSGAFTAFVVDQLEGLGNVMPRSMFGGVGLYCGGIFFGIIAGDVLYLKAGAGNRSDYEQAEMAPFKPYPNRPGTMQYYAVPVGVLETAPELVEWARKAVAAAGRPGYAPRREPLPALPQEAASGCAQRARK